MEDLFWLFAAACSLRFAYAGTQVWSFLGLPIGGLLSKVAASTVLGWQEHCWNFDQNRRQVAQYWWDDRLWSHSVARGRYVDDLIGSAGRFASLEEGVQHAYSVPFEVTVPGHDGVLTWLDFIFFCPLCVGQQIASNLCHPCHGRRAKLTLSVCFLGGSLAGRRCSCCLKIWQRPWCSCSVTS